MLYNKGGLDVVAVMEIIPLLGQVIGVVFTELTTICAPTVKGHNTEIMIISIQRLFFDIQKVIGI
jgi:hypothetical protein